MAPPTRELSPIEIGRMGSDDLDDVVRIENESFSNPWKRRHFELALLDDTCCVVAKIGGKVVGYGIGWFAFREIHIANLAVAGGWRGKGIGSAILRYMMDRAGERGAVMATLEVRTSNIAAINLYRKEGFREIAIRKDYYTKPREDAIVMAKFLRGDRI